MVLRRQFSCMRKGENGREGEAIACLHSLVSFHCAPTGGYFLQSGLFRDWPLFPPEFKNVVGGKAHWVLRRISLNCFWPYRVGSRTGAVFRRSDLAVSPRFLWECLNSQTMNPFPAPATSHPACGFPALGAPVCLVSRVMWPIVLGRLSHLTIEQAGSC